MANTRIRNLQVSKLNVQGIPTVGGVSLGTSQVVDLQGNAAALVLDDAAVVTLDGNTAGHAKLKVSGSTVVDASAAATALTGTLSVSGAATLSAAATVGTTLGVTGILTATGGIKLPVVTITGDGAITIAPFTLVKLSKGSAAAITLAAPTNTTHDGYIVIVFSTSAFAHVITGGVDGFNAKGSSGTITFANSIGSATVLVAMGGHWYTLAGIGATVA